MDVPTAQLPGDAQTGKIGRDRRFRGWMVVALLLALEIAKLWLFTSAGPAPVVSDAAGYWELGQQAARGDVFLAARPIAYRTPGYPWFLGLCQTAAGHNAWLLATIAQGVVILGTSILTYALIRRLGGSRNLALAGWGWSALSLARASFFVVLLTETLFTGLLIALLMHLLETPAPPSVRRGLQIGGLWGLLCLVRPVGLALAPAVVAALVLPARQYRFPRRLLVRDLVVTIGTAGLLLAPWCLRNSALFGKPTLVAFAGRELWLATYGPGSPIAPPVPDAPGVRVLKAAIPDQQLPEVNWQKNWSVSSALTANGHSDATADELMLRASWEGVTAAPDRFVARGLVRQIDFWRAVYTPDQALYAQPEFAAARPPSGQNLWGSGRAAGLRQRLLSSAPAGRLLFVELTSLLALLGLVGTLLPAANRAGIILTASVASLAILTAAFELPDYRYRMVLEPLLIAATLVGGQIWCRVIRLGVAALRQE